MSGRLLLDEMFHPSIAAELAERGHDCRSVVADPALGQRADPDLVALAVAEGRTLVTNNVVDFERLRRDRIAEAAPVPPLIYTSDSSFPRSRRYVGRMVEALDAALKTDAAGRQGRPVVVTVRLSPTYAERARPGGVLWLSPSD